MFDFSQNKKKSTYVLAEMASSHEGDPKIAEFIIKSAAEAGANGVLFQLINLDSYIIPSDEDYKKLKIIYLKQKVWAKLIKKANSLKLDVWANVYDRESAKFCRNKQIRGFKLHSANLENEDLIKEVVKSKKELLLSVGGMEKSEIEKILKLIYSINKKTKITLMYGLQSFPTNPEGVNLNFIKNLSKKLNLPWGYQDHSEPTSSASTYLPILSIAQGAEILEKHITHNRSFKGRDHQAALNPKEFAKLVEDIKRVNNLVNKKPKEISPDELKYREYKSLMKVVAQKNIETGRIFSKDNLWVMRAKKGEIKGSQLKFLLNKKAKGSYRNLEPIKKTELFKTGIFITARLKSKRLPNKITKPILGKPMVEWMIDRLKRCNIDPIVMMTSTNPQDDPLIKIAKSNHIHYFRGSEEDVLLRMRDCARKFDVDSVISATADNPLTEPIYIEKMIDRFLETNFDFCEIEGLPKGFKSYAVSKKALERVCRIKDSSDTEIWGPYFRKSGQFNCEKITAQDPNIFRPYYRATVDTPEDFQLMKELFKILSREKDYFNVYDVCRLLDERKDLVKINARIKQVKPPKIRIKKGSGIYRSKD